MDIRTHTELQKSIADIVDYMVDHEDDFYVALDIAYQLQDELKQCINDE